MRARLVGHGVNARAAPHDLRQNFRAVADQTDGDCALLPDGVFTDRERLVQVQSEAVAVARAHAPLDVLAVNFHAEEDRAVQSRREWLRAAHAAHAARQD